LTSRAPDARRGWAAESRRTIATLGIVTMLLSTPGKDAAKELTKASSTSGLDKYAAINAAGSLTVNVKLPVITNCSCS